MRTMCHSGSGNRDTCGGTVAQAQTLTWLLPSSVLLDVMGSGFDSRMVPETLKAIQRGLLRDSVPKKRAQCTPL